MSILVDIEKDFGGFRLRANFEAGNETLALLGASGCGKSVTLRCIAGIEKPDRGRIVLDGRTLFDSEKRINLSPQKRKTGLLSQNYALFPNMTVRKNIETGLRRGAKKDSDAVSRVIEEFELNAVADHYPRQISGGQQQRTALARILISDPGILLLDEPFSALDTHLRFRLEESVKQVIDRFGKTVIWVSHDRDEVFRRVDRIAIMHDGIIERIGEKHDVFSDPKTRYGAMLTGCRNISAAKRIDDTHIMALDWGISLTLAQTPSPETARDVASVGIRNHMVRLAENESENIFSCHVAEIVENPFTYTVLLKPEGAHAKAKAFGIELSKEKPHPTPGDMLKIVLPPEALLVLTD